MRIIVTGGRDNDDTRAIWEALDRLHKTKGPITLLVHGACCDREHKQLCGADRWAEQWAIRNEVQYIGVPAKWSEHGDAAGPKRNLLMPVIAGVAIDGVVAFRGGAGTADMVGVATRAGIKVWKPQG